MNNQQDANDPLGAQSVHVAGEITVTRRHQDSPPRKPRRNYDSPPTIALRRGFSFDATPQLPVRVQDEPSRAQVSFKEVKAPEKALSADSGLSLAECIRKKYLADRDRPKAA